MRPSPVRSPPVDPDWALELKWGGVRAIAFCGSDGVRLQGARGNDLTGLFPEIEDLGTVPAARETVFDGELVSFTERGIPDLAEIARRARLSPAQARSQSPPGFIATYVIYDLLWGNGIDTRPFGYRRRRELLAARNLDGPTWRVPDYVIGEPKSTLWATVEEGLEGLAMKKLDSPYVGSSAFSPWWLTIGNPRRQDFVVGGWRLEKDQRGRTETGLLLGYWDYAKALGHHLRFAGTVRARTGSKVLESLASDLESLKTDATPFANLPPGEGAHRFVKPIKVVEVSFRGWDEEGQLRDPTLASLGRYREPGAVRREPEE